MKALIFNGSLERRPSTTSALISDYIVEKLSNLEVTSSIFNINDSGIPLFDNSLNKIPKGVELMNNLFLEADLHFWLAPLYHGSIPGVMKNCLDWLEVSAQVHKPYLTNKTIGLICWADGGQAMQGINAMDTIAKSLRAWTLPFNIPIVRPMLFTTEESKDFSSVYTNKFDLLINLGVKHAQQLNSYT